MRPAFSSQKDTKQENNNGGCLAREKRKSRDARIFCVKNDMTCF